MEELRQIERRTLDRQEALREADKPKAKPKEGKSTFDELLEQSRQLSQKLGESKTLKQATQEALPAVERQKEKQRERSKDSDKEEERKQDSNSEKKESADGHKRVVGKASLKQNQGNSQGGSSGDGSTSQRKGERSHLITKRLASEKGMVVGSGDFAKEFQAQLSQNLARTMPKTIPQEILNQVVRYVRVGMLRNGTKVVELDCHEEIFKGLSLRFQVRDGKVRIEFLTANPETKKLFEKEAKNLRETLETKGIAVESLVVT